MKIDSYNFGEIVIDGKKYDEDTIIFDKEVFSPWWREKGHLLSKEDLSEILKKEPEILIIGKGAAGIMQVPEEVQNFIVSQGIQCLILNTKEACDKFNELKSSDKKVIAALHLTC